jgi:hypothetical protein
VIHPKKIDYKIVVKKNKKHIQTLYYFGILLIFTLCMALLLMAEPASGEAVYAPVPTPKVETVQTTTPAPKPAVIAKSSQLSPSQEEVADQIRAIAKEMGYQAPEWLVRLARCESGLRPNALGDGGHSRGLFQIHSGYHPTVTDEQAYSIDFSTRWTINKLMNGGSGLWTCTKIIS